MGGNLVQLRSLLRTPPIPLSGWNLLLLQGHTRWVSSACVLLYPRPLSSFYQPDAKLLPGGSLISCSLSMNLPVPIAGTSSSVFFSVWTLAAHWGYQGPHEQTTEHFTFSCVRLPFLQWASPLLHSSHNLGTVLCLFHCSNSVCHRPTPFL